MAEYSQGLSAAARCSRWSFDATMLPQYAQHARPGILQRCSVDGGAPACSLAHLHCAVHLGRYSAEGLHARSVCAPFSMLWIAAPLMHVAASACSRSSLSEEQQVGSS